MQDEVYSFWHASGECAQEQGAKFNSVSIFRNFDKSPIHIGSIERTEKAIKHWMENSSLPTLIEFGTAFVKPVFKQGLASIILYTDEKDTEYIKVFEEAAHAL